MIDLTQWSHLNSSSLAVVYIYSTHAAEHAHACTVDCIIMWCLSTSAAKGLVGEKLTHC